MAGDGGRAQGAAADRYGRVQQGTVAEAAEGGEGDGQGKEAAGRAGPCLRGNRCVRMYFSEGGGGGGSACRFAMSNNLDARNLPMQLAHNRARLPCPSLRGRLDIYVCT